MRSLPTTPLPQSSSSRRPSLSIRYPLHAPPASCQAGDFPRTVSSTRWSLRVKRRLLLSRRKLPRRLAPALLAEHEPHLARRAEPLGAVGAERRAGLVECERAQPVPAEEAVVARDLSALAACVHPPSPSFTR